jgi:formylglycine-generating enzyme required for sulfatase activity
MVKEKITQPLPALSQPFDMIFVEGGTYNMGDEHGDLPDFCRPVHRVQVSGFYIGKFPVTQALWKAVMNGENPSGFKGDERPVEWVSWDDIANHFLPALCRLSGFHYRLPSEAEWEYAARGGKYHAEGYKYAGSDRLKDAGWFKDNNGKETKPVGQKQPNQLGIYDMSGNVWEWCEDDWHNNYNGAPEDGSAWINSPNRGSNRVVRGGGWVNSAQDCRAACRGNNSPGTRSLNLGFRLALSLQADGRPMPAFL